MPYEIIIFLMLMIITVIGTVASLLISLFIIAPRKKWSFPLATSGLITGFTLGILATGVGIYVIYIAGRLNTIRFFEMFGIFLFGLIGGGITYAKIRLFEHEHYYDNVINAKNRT